ncbi:hypothetical protein EYF80_037254 [Liparis tanakae]|uniref:Uncharacterized protein n=1 Tax=Liparis tanakae TaxID=230148 RepID=A0A4Z2GG89_9TELE|nr:hypothetical protein EYF80_037254 [Liparis tanakae]
MNEVPYRQPLQVALWEAPGSVSPGEASHLQGPGNQSPKPAGNMSNGPPTDASQHQTGRPHPRTTLSLCI